MVAQNRPSLGIALIPVVFLISALLINVHIFTRVFDDDALDGSNQIILILAGILAGYLALRQGKTWDDVFTGVAESIKETAKPILILLMIGALAGGWLISGVIPAFVYYGVQVLDASYFLPAAIVISAIVSLATGSSWNTTATIGLALLGIGTALGFSAPMTAGAVISGAYFGDKMSPLSDTTNLAPGMAGTDLFTHIRYMTYTTVPSILITLIVFTIMGLYTDVGATTGGALNISDAIQERFNITPWLMIVPAITITMLLMKMDAILAILAGAVSGGIFAIIFQPQIVAEVAGVTELTASAAYLGVMKSLGAGATLAEGNELLEDLLSSGGMGGMLNTIFLIISAMFFGGAMQSGGFLQRISRAIISIAHSSAGLITSTIGTGVFLNFSASDQYLAIVIPGKMYRDIYKERGLAPENLSRSLEDSGTVTSALIPWNTCGAYQSGVLGVATGEYFIYAMFNWLSPIMSLIFAWFNIKIRKIETTASPSAENNESEGA